MTVSFTCMCGGKTEKKIKKKPLIWGDFTEGELVDAELWVCDKCGEEYYSIKEAKRLENLSICAQSRRKS